MNNKYLLFKSRATGDNLSLTTRINHDDGWCCLYTELNSMAQAHEPISSQLLAIDEQLTQLVSDIDILSSVNPLNYALERESFINNKYSQEPNFEYQKTPLITPTNPNVFCMSYH
ncbi:hypothetical protein P4S64_24370 [Vibrio sp. M60_M31a]